MPANLESSIADLLDAVRRLFVMWHLTDNEITQIFPHLDMFGDLSLTSLSASTEELVRRRASTYLEIHEYLTALYASPEALRFSWFKKQNRAFGGKSPFEIIADRPDYGLQTVRTYLAGVASP